MHSLTTWDSSPPDSNEKSMAKWTIWCNERLVKIETSNQYFSFLVGWMSIKLGARSKYEIAHLSKYKQHSYTRRPKFNTRTIIVYVKCTFCFDFHCLCAVSLVKYSSCNLFWFVASIGSSQWTERAKKRCTHIRNIRLVRRLINVISFFLSCVPWMARPQPTVLL